MKLSTMTRRSFLKSAAIVGAATALSGTSVPQALAEDDLVDTKDDVKVIRTACRGCGKMECGVLVTVRNGRAIKVEGDPDAFASDANCCSKSQASIQACYHPDRLMYPMKRTNPKDASDPGWVRISWDEAFKLAADNIQSLKDKYGGETFYSMVGTSRVWAMGGLMAWPQILGTPNTLQAYQICKGPRHYATRLVSNRAFSWMATVDRPRVFVQWGGASEISNYDDSCRTTVDCAVKADKHIVVDPRMAGIGRQADYWMHLRPGTDAAVAMCWTNVILENDLIDHLFVKRWTNAPFLVMPGEATFSSVQAYGPGRTWELKTRLLKESDVVEGGSPTRFMVWDTLANKLTYFDTITGLWENEPPFTPPTKGKEARQDNLMPGVAKGFVPDPTPFNPKIDPAIYGEFEVTLANGSSVKVRPVLDVYAERCREYTPQKAEVITGVPASQLEAAAKAYATRLDPESGYGNGGIQYMLAVEHAATAIQNCRAIDAITALTGNYDTPAGQRGPTMAPVDGGFTPFAFMIPGAAMQGHFPDSSKEIGDDEFPVNRWWGGWADANTLYRAMETGKPYPIKGGVNMAGDFMNMTNANDNWNVLQKMEFIIECNLWHAPSSDVADLLLPAWHWLEVNCSRVSQGSSGAFGANIRCVEPPADTLWDPLIIMGVAKAMGIYYAPDPENPWPGSLPDNWEPAEQFILDNAVKGTGKSWKEYAAEFTKNGWWDAKVEEPNRWGTYRRYETGYIIGGSAGMMGGEPIPPTPGWNTPTKKYELWSTIIESHYLNGEFDLPTYSEPPHSPISDPETAKDYPLIVTTGRRIPVYFHSEHRQLPWCRELWPTPRCEVNPEDAAELGIEQGDWIWIETKWGKVRQVADLYYGIKKGTICCEHQWWFPELNESGHGFQLSGINCVNDRDAQCPICGASNLRAYLGKIYKATAENCPGGKVVPCAADGTPIITSAADPRLKEWLPTYEGRE
ncbi:MAG: molybdopterin-dependent oxidoreductase [Coriobacteriales bacterium]|jgi:anaerobic selenocysteine-containing dehydrogenase|nr:molybdopterin-dependent oxidoreductase [Coriobacteriales bacterium]